MFPQGGNKSETSTSWLPLLGERGEAQEGDIALLAVSDRDPGGDELIWTGATAPSTAEQREDQFTAWSHTPNSKRDLSAHMHMKQTSVHTSTRT